MIIIKDFKHKGSISTLNRLVEPMTFMIYLNRPLSR